MPAPPSGAAIVDAQDPEAREIWKQRHSRFREKAVVWVKSHPLAMPSIVRMVIEPFRTLIASSFRFASVRWETSQRARAPRAGGGSQREYRAFVAATCKMEESFYRTIKSLLTDDRCVFFPNNSKRINFRHRAFRMLSRAGCSVKELLHSVHIVYPFKWFLCLPGPSIAEVVEHERSCILDDVCNEWRERFKVFCNLTEL